MFTFLLVVHAVSLTALLGAIVPIFFVAAEQQNVGIWVAFGVVCGAVLYSALGVGYYGRELAGCRGIRIGLVARRPVDGVRPHSNEPSLPSADRTCGPRTSPSTGSRVLGHIHRYQEGDMAVLLGLVCSLLVLMTRTYLGCSAGPRHLQRQLRGACSGRHSCGCRAGLTRHG